MRILSSLNLRPVFCTQIVNGAFKGAKTGILLGGTIGIGIMVSPFLMDLFQNIIEPALKKGTGLNYKNGQIKKLHYSSNPKPFLPFEVTAAIAFGLLAGFALGGAIYGGIQTSCQKEHRAD